MAPDLLCPAHQVMPVLEKTIAALEQEGAEVVKFDYELMKHAVDEWVPYRLSCDWEMPRELARYIVALPSLYQGLIIRQLG